MREKLPHGRTDSNGKPTILARLQTLLPTSPRAPSRAHISSSNPPKLPALSLADKPDEPRFLKVRLMTWNMHDSLPKGNIEELLGRVETYSSSDTTDTVSSIPQFATGDSHPYHLVVFAGQECPTTSGIPMGIGAGFKSKDKENYEASEKTSKSRRTLNEDMHNDPYMSGWTAMLEDWFCHGGCLSATSHDASVSGSAASSLKQTLHSCKEKKGPYQLLVKERMMGIYLAVFVHRDARSLVKGTSKSAVAAGLIGGRLGNKGGVGISVNLDGTTLLFLNAHLAAHEGRIHHRLANLSKIKAELTVDHFLASDDPRMVSEDVTDKFDYTFLCGDLNFRLDISRLHADWLIAREEYAQALAFDQLQNLMRNGQAFVGFCEGTIQFPPTFKYDVMRTLKKSRRARWRAHRSLTGVEEKESESPDDEDDEEDGEEAEVASVASSTWTSLRNQEGGEDYFHPSSTTHQDAVQSSRIAISATAAASKAKNKWLQIVNTSPSSPLSSMARSLHRTQSSKDGGRSLATDASESRHEATERASMDSNKPSSKRRGSTDLMKHVSSTKSGYGGISDSEEDNGDNDYGVYDSSSKKRVPSWCDRILWKSTVKPDPEPEDKGLTDTQPRTRNRTSIGQLIANAFHRPHRESISSALSNESTATPIHDSVSDSPGPISPYTLDPSAMPFSRFAALTTGATETNPSNLRTSRSYDAIQLSNRSDSGSVTPHQRAPHRRVYTTLPSITTNTTTLRPSSAGNLSSRPENTEIANTFVIRETPSSDSTQLGFLGRLFPFMSKLDKEPTSQPVRADDTETVIIPPKPLHKKGDVVCLSYDTLDDRRMRKLEGRSDHRPVIGTYAIYL